MDNFLLYLHPVVQVFALSLGLYALWQGWLKVKMSHFRKKVIFPWKSHIRLGSLAMLLWLFGGLGFYYTHTVFGETHITGAHANVAWAVFALCLFGLANGAIMDRYKKKRVWLPIIHGLANLILLLLALYEFYTGFEIWGDFA